MRAISLIEGYFIMINTRKTTGLSCMTCTIDDGFRTNIDNKERLPANWYLQ